jgi:hypothetical protein
VGRRGESRVARRLGVGWGVGLLCKQVLGWEPYLNGTGVRQRADGCAATTAECHCGEASNATNEPTMCDQQRRQWV